MERQARTNWNDGRLDDLANQVRALREHVDDRFDRIDDRFDRIDDRFDRIDDRSGRIDDRFDRIDDRFEGLNVRFDAQSARIEKRFDNLTYGLIYTMASLLAAFGGALVALH
jgi:hypothetical protein